VFHFLVEKMLMSIVMQKREQHWDPVTGDGVGLFAIGLGILIALIFRSEPGFVYVVDHANLIFREVGHSIVSFFNADLACYGGAVGQLILPCFMTLSFRRQGSPLGFAAASIWLCENLINISHNLADLGAKAPPLIGGADHDWPKVIVRTGLHPYEPNIVYLMTMVAWAGMASVCLWVLWRAWQSGRHTAPIRRAALN
jgi:hypothetical protein